MHARAVQDELGQLQLAQHSSASVMQRVVDLVAEVMPRGIEVSITLVGKDRPATGAFTGHLARELDEVQYERGSGPCLEAALGGALVEIRDGRAENRWSAYVPVFLARGARSALVVPVPTAPLATAINVYARTDHVFTADDRTTLVAVAAYAGAALTNMEVIQGARDLAEGMQKAMEFRAVIEQAKGILMERHKLTADQAFRLLADASMSTNRKLRDVAEALALTGELQPIPRERR